MYTKHVGSLLLAVGTLAATSQTFAANGQAAQLGPVKVNSTAAKSAPLQVAVTAQYPAVRAAQAAASQAVPRKPS